MPISETFNTDCLLYLKDCKDKQFDIGVCDPPWGIDVANMAYLTEVNTTVKQKNGSRLNGNKQKQIHIKKDWDLTSPTQEYFNELRRVTKHQIIFGVDYFDWEGIGTGRIKWNKMFAEGMSFKSYEMAYCSLIDDEIEIKLLWAGMCQAESLDFPTTQQGNKKKNEKRIHPCHKPILLYKMIYQMFVKEGWSIYDSHLGGQSSRIAAYDMGIDFYGNENDFDYFTQGNARFETHRTKCEEIKEESWSRTEVQKIYPTLF